MKTAVALGLAAMIQHRTLWNSVAINVCAAVVQLAYRILKNTTSIR